MESIANPILMGQDEIVYRNCNLLKAQEAVIFVEVFSATTRELVCSVGQRPGTGEWTFNYKNAINFDHVTGEKAAEIGIIFSLRDLQKEISAWIFFGASWAVIIMIVHGLFYVSLSRMVARPISFIETVVSTGNPTEIVETLGDKKWKIKEINSLARQIGWMSKHILDYQSQLLSSERDRVVSELAKQVAHDIRSPLSALKLINSLPPAEMEKAGGLMSGIIARMEAMADDLLARGRREPAMICVREIVQSCQKVVDEFSLKAKSKGVAILIDHKTERFGCVLCNIDDFERVLVNLLENALAVSVSGQSIEVRTEKLASRFMISVSDHGPGFDSEIIFNVGKIQLKSSKPGGHGIGLYGVYRVVRSWTGSVDIQTKPGSGSTVSVSLPLQES